MERILAKKKLTLKIQIFSNKPQKIDFNQIFSNKMKKLTKNSNIFKQNENNFWTDIFGNFGQVGFSRT